MRKTARSKAVRDSVDRLWATPEYTPGGTQLGSPVGGSGMASDVFKVASVFNIVQRHGSSQMPAGPHWPSPTPPQHSTTGDYEAPYRQAGATKLCASNFQSTAH